MTVTFQEQAALAAPVPPAAPTAAGTRPLSALRSGARARIAVVSPERGEHLARRLADLGFVAGQEVEVVRRAPLGDPVVYLVADYEICLRKRDAALVLTEELPR